MEKANLGSKTKLLWDNPEYRKHMSEVHKGQKAWNKGLPFSKQTTTEVNEIRKEKISKSLKLAYAEGRKEKHMLGKEYPLSSRLKQSATLKKLYALGIIKSRNQGKTSARKKLMHSLDYKLWRLEIFERDLFTCKCCNKKGGKLRAHHINEYSKYPELRLDINNGITLCNDCHIKVHTK
jgi:hypothetical protein